METDDELHWLILARMPRISDRVLRRLQSAASSPREILSASEARWRAAGAGPALLGALRSWRRRGESHPAHRQALSDLAVLRREDARVLALGAADYPALLAEIHDPPPLLFAAGLVETLAQPQLAIVGSRRNAAASARAATEFAGELVKSGFGICSGMALGIDAAAHCGALDAGGFTCAVMATGIDGCYPRRHRELAESIRRQGVLLTEFPPGSPPRRERFPMRNRIISGLSVGVLVVEASLRSGSLITARLALEQNREVFALPHSIYDPGGRGCHALIRDGAALVEQPADILQEVGSLCLAQRSLRADGDPPAPLPEQLARVYGALGYEPLSVDDLVRRGGADPGQIMADLVELQVRGLIERRDGLYMRK